MAGAGDFAAGVAAFSAACCSTGAGKSEPESVDSAVAVTAGDTGDGDEVEAAANDDDVVAAAVAGSASPSAEEDAGCSLSVAMPSERATVGAEGDASRLKLIDTASSKLGPGLKGELPREASNFFDQASPNSSSLFFQIFAPGAATPAAGCGAATAAAASPLPD